jgi:hypothetical protein
LTPIIYTLSRIVSIKPSCRCAGDVFNTVALSEELASTVVFTASVSLDEELADGGVVGESSLFGVDDMLIGCSSSASFPVFKLVSHTLVMNSCLMEEGVV